MIHFSNNPCVFFPRKAEQKSRPCFVRFKDTREHNIFFVSSCELLIKNDILLYLYGYTSSAPQNNPGWYLPEDDGTGGVAIQRRNMPLLKDNTSLFVLSQKTKVNESVTIHSARTSNVFSCIFPQLSWKCVTRYRWPS